MWRSILEELQANNGVGPALPIACFRHPDKLHRISRPGQLPQVAPDGESDTQNVLRNTELATLQVGA